MEGFNTIGFLLNGEAVVSESPDATIADNRYFGLESEADWYYKSQIGIDLKFELIDDPLTIKTYQLNDSSLRTEIIEYIRCYGWDSCNAVIEERYNGTGYASLVKDSKCYTYTDGLYGSGILEITHFDTLNLIISGTFNFTISHPDCSNFEVTDGRFDVRYSKVKG